MDSKSDRKCGIIQILAINFLLALMLLECLLQVVNAVGHGNTNPVVKAVYWYIKPHLSWEEWFLLSYMDKGNMIYAGIHRHHPTRGWAMRPSSQFKAHPKITYTTNAQGYRALYDFENKPGKYQVIVLGDSFSFGDEINDLDTWPHLLQMSSPLMNVLNMAGTGYGTDQMLITLEEEVKKYHPDLIVAAFIDDNLYRSTLPFRDYKKPLFALNSGKLELANVPIGDPYSVLQEISHRRYWSYGNIQTLNLIGFFVNDLTMLEGSPECNRQCKRINTAIFDKMSEISIDNGAEFMVVYLPRGKEIISNDVTSYGENFFYEYSLDKQDYFFNPRAMFVEAEFNKSPEHYHINENKLLSGLVREKIEKTKSWRCERKEKCWH